jgi:hypothetical protein
MCSIVPFRTWTSSSNPSPTSHRTQCQLWRPNTTTYSTINERRSFYKVKPIPAQCFILTFGRFPEVWILYAGVSEHSRSSIFIGGVSRNIPIYTAYEDGTECSESRHMKIRCRGITHNKTTTFRTRRKFEIMNNPCTSLGRSWGFQNVEVSRFQDSRHVNVIRLSALGTVRLYPQVIFMVLISGKGWVDPRAIVQCLNQMRHPVSPAVRTVSVIVVWFNCNRIWSTNSKTNLQYPT